MTLESAFTSVICMGVHCTDDNCACCTCNGCLYNELSERELVEIAKKRYAENANKGR